MINGKKQAKRKRLGAFLVGSLSLLIVVASLIPSGASQMSIENEVIETMDLSGVSAIVLTDENSSCIKNDEYTTIELSSEEVEKIQQMISELEHEEDRNIVRDIMDYIMQDNFVDMGKARDIAQKLYGSIDNNANPIISFRKASEEEETVARENTLMSVSLNQPLKFTPTTGDGPHYYEYIVKNSVSNGVAEASSGGNVEGGVVGAYTKSFIGSAAGWSTIFVRFEVDLPSNIDN